MPQVLEQDQTVNIAKALFGTSVSEPPRPPVRRSQHRRWLYLLAVVAVVVAATALWRAKAGTATPEFVAAEVKRGSIAKTIAAMGRLQALTTVQVGTQVSGTISELYVDFNSQVKKGQVIARLDPSQLQAQLTQVSANLAAAQASVQTAQMAILAADSAVESAQANVDRADSVLAEANRTLQHTKDLVAAGAVARRQIEIDQAAAAQASSQKQQAVAQANQSKAQAQSARSQLNQSRAQAAQATASVQLAQVNLEKTVITAPIDGIIVARSVDVGQTVAASLQAPTLFLIANDLTRMQVLADIDEADLGQLQQGTKASFTVDAYPAETFSGHISQIRLAPQTLQNVVTYTAVIDVMNPDMKLKPGMTANVTAVVSEQENVLTVPNSALRFKPVDAQAARPRPGAGTVYRLGGDGLEAAHVRMGLTDGVKTQIVSGLNEGDQVATPAQSAAQRRPNAPATSMPGMGAPRGAGRIR